GEPSIPSHLAPAVAEHEPIVSQFTLNCLNRGANTFVSDRQKTGERHYKEARVQRIRPIDLGESFLLRVIAALANLCMNLIANFLPATDVFMSRAAAVLNHLDRAIERQPGHHF